MTTRLPGRKYKDIFDRGRPFKGRLLVAWRLNEAGAGRFAGVVVSKKTFHDAVDRSRAKRLMREAYRLLAKSEGVPVDSLWVFIARASIGNAKCADVMADIRRICDRC